MKGKAGKKNRKSRFFKRLASAQGRSAPSKLKFIRDGKKNVAFRCLEIRPGLRKEQPFCAHHNRLTGEASGRKENQTRLQKMSSQERRQICDADGSGGQKGEKGDVHPSAAAMVVRESTSCLVAFNVATGGGAPLRDCGRS